MADSDDAIGVVLVAMGSEQQGAALARALVGEALCACVNIIPKVTSVYRWKGQLIEDAESLLVIKTRRSRFEALRARIVELHGYEVPEIIFLDVSAAHEPYLRWVLEASG
jgi:periplasmic divalent cation tolerance protein